MGTVWNKRAVHGTRCGTRKYNALLCMVRNNAGHNLPGQTYNEIKAVYGAYYDCEEAEDRQLN